jgi:hypothetical protein
MDSDYSDDLMNYYCYTAVDVVVVMDRNDAVNDLVAVVDNDADFDDIHNDIDNLRGYFVDRMNMTRKSSDDDDVLDGEFRNS